ncbi:MAG: NTP transferase domain-containing protein [Anaerolineales bacterium]|nr:NTP transferase domain-containing protein [Anaerolineales bacterium]MDW8227097.1 NTP transferase domain-containing protein [Anaerolineales bacterium]
MEGRCYVLRLFGPGLVPDLLPGCCPLSGLHVGLAASHPIVAVIACEMPFISAALLETAARILVREGVDVIIPRSDRGLEPMHAAYRRKTSLSVIGQAIEAK